MSKERLNDLEVAVLLSSAGHVVVLPYDDRDAMNAAIANLAKRRLIAHDLVDDQPTCTATPVGEALARELYKSYKPE